MLQPQSLEALRAAFPAVTSSEFRGDTRIVVPHSEIYDALEFLRDDRAFDFLVDITCVDYLAFRDAEHRFGLVYLLTNLETNERITVRTSPDRTVETGSALWVRPDLARAVFFDAQTGRRLQTM